MIQLTLTLKMTTTRVVETSVIVNNSAIQDYLQPDDYIQHKLMKWLLGSNLSQNKRLFMYLLPRCCNKKKNLNQNQLQATAVYFQPSVMTARTPKKNLTSKCLHFLGHSCRSISVCHMNYSFPNATEAQMEDASLETSGNLRNQTAKASKSHRNRHIKSEFALFQTSSLLSRFVQVV